MYFHIIERVRREKQLSFFSFTHLVRFLLPSSISSPSNWCRWFSKCPGFISVEIRPRFRLYHFVFEEFVWVLWGFEENSSFKVFFLFISDWFGGGEECWCGWSSWVPVNWNFCAILLISTVFCLVNGKCCKMSQLWILGTGFPFDCWENVGQG